MMTLRWLLFLFISALSPGFGIFASTSGLPGDVVYCIYQDHNGALWFGTDTGLNRWKDGKSTVFTTKDGLSGNTITALFEDRDNKLWVGTMGKGLNRYDQKYNTFTLYSSKEHGLTGDMIYAIHQDDSGDLWIGTSTGLNQLKEGRFISYTVNDGLSNNIVRAITHDRENNLWIGTDGGGLNLFKNGKFNLFDTEKGLSNDRIVSIYVDRDGVLWLGTLNGLNRFKDGVFTVFGREDGLHSNRVFQVLEDQQQHLWIGSDTGIFRMSKEELSDFAEGKISRIQAVLYNQKEKTKGPVCVGGFQPSAIKARDGKLYFSTLNGVAAINPASFNVEPKPSFFQGAWFYISISIIFILAVFLPFYLWVRRLKARERELEAQVELRTRDLEQRNLELQKARENILKSKELMVVKNQQLEAQSNKLKDMDEVKSRFFANISHEFRTPLTLIMGPLEQMIAACPGDVKDKKRTLTMMLRNAQRLLRLINQLLDLSKLDSGRMKLQAAKTDMVSFVKGITDSFRMLAHQNETDLVFCPEDLNESQAEEENITLYLDRRKMEDVVSNLLMNAIKFTPAGGKITVCVKGNPAAAENFPAGYVELSVCDTGSGIPAAQLAQIFNRFYQADSSYEHHSRGTGIGLALARELVELHQGTIKAESEKGKGSEFTIRLPMGSAHLSPGEIVNLPPSETLARTILPMEITAPDTIDEEDGKEGETGLDAVYDLEPGAEPDEKNIILVVEDSADVRDYIRGELEPVYNVVDAGDGREGLKKAQEIIPDLIVSDIMMPEMDGYELCRALKEDIETSHIPVILLTARASEESVVKGLGTGADDYITKPFSSKILKARIKNLIDLRKQLQQNFKREMARQPVEIAVSAIDKEFVKDLKAVIEENLSDPDFNVHDMCRKLSMSQPTLYRKIQALSGESPTDFIRSYRLKRASQLLESNFGSVTEVAFEVGFSSRTYFTKCFKEKFHRLPSTYLSSKGGAPRIS
jgi:signal transduction histidine kinase/DNA-binding response OmpR family regulator/streptogramin lyase